MSDYEKQGIKFPCNQCESKFTQNSSLKIHKMSVHDNIKYLCNLCDSKFTQKGHLNTHKMSVHESIKYP